MPGVISVRLPDGSVRELAVGTTAGALAKDIGPRLAKAAVLATVDGREVDLDSALRCPSSPGTTTPDERCCGIRRPT
jgi:threonyl-tRNA synthetase